MNYLAGMFLSPKEYQKFLIRRDYPYQNLIHSLETTPTQTSWQTKIFFTENVPSLFEEVIAERGLKVKNVHKSSGAYHTTVCGNVQTYDCLRVEVELNF